jgi:hypothetical protein
VAHSSAVDAAGLLADAQHKEALTDWGQDRRDDASINEWASVTQDVNFPDS